MYSCRDLTESLFTLSPPIAFPIRAVLSVENPGLRPPQWRVSLQSSARAGRLVPWGCGDDFP